jgi:hypothetical protein
MTPEKEQAIMNLDTVMRNEIKKISGLFPVNIHLDVEKSPWNVLVEAVGTRMITTAEIARLEKAVSRRLSQPVTLSVWFRQEAVVTSKGYGSIEEETKKRLIKRRKIVRDLYAN